MAKFPNPKLWGGWSPKVSAPEHTYTGCVRLTCVYIAGMIHISSYSYALLDPDEFPTERRDNVPIKVGSHQIVHH